MSESNELRIVDYRSEETNPYADPDKAHNGGGYSQPNIDVKFSDGISVSISDTSCGDFGSRISASITDGEEVFHAHWGSMEPDNYFSDIDENIYADHLNIIAEELGYEIPSEQDCAAWDIEREDYEDDVETPEVSDAVEDDREFDEAFIEGDDDDDSCDDVGFD
jgi:hypothetical protein